VPNSGQARGRVHAGCACLYMRVPPLLIEGARVALVELLILRHAGWLNGGPSEVAGEDACGGVREGRGREQAVLRMLEAAVGRLGGEESVGCV
jgi:hypothetical protein